VSALGVVLTASLRHDTFDTSTSDLGGFTMTEKTQAEKIQAFADLVLEQTREHIARRYSQRQADAEQVEVIPGPKYTKVDLGVPFFDDGHVGSGKYMVENATGIIYGIKGYGRVHKGHMYGTLDTIDRWYWGEYSPVKRG
jgi:hypothetical protein